MKPTTKITEFSNRKELHYEDEHGDADFTIYPVFDGILLVFSSIHTSRCSLSPTMDGDIIEISHCLEGRMEKESEDDFFFLTPGDMSVMMRRHVEFKAVFPTGHYHGVTVVIRAGCVPNAFRILLKEDPVNPKDLVQRLCRDGHYFVSRSKEYVSHIFTEFYTVPESIRDGFFKVKILELLLMLSTVEPHNDTETVCRLTPSQVKLAKEVAGHLYEHTGKRITIPELAAKFHVSSSHLKTVFKAVYGVPVSSWARYRKMQEAAHLLIYSNKKIAEISSCLGYQQESKFVSAFKKIMGETPSEYRKAHYKNTVSD